MRPSTDSIRRGVAVPVVSANVSCSTPASIRDEHTDSTSAAVTSSSNDDPNAHETTASTIISPSREQIDSTWVMDSATVMPTFCWLYTGDADTVTVRCRGPASNAISAPRRFGTSAHHVGPFASRPATTSAAPAMAGTVLGETKATASTCCRPAAASAFDISTRNDTPSGVSPCRPSRGPTSRMTTRSLRSDYPLLLDARSNDSSGLALT